MTMKDSRTVSMDDFTELYETFGPMVLRRCRFLLKDEDRALDAMQDTFVRIIERREKLSGACASLFYTVATTVCLNRIRSERLRSSPQIDHLLSGIADTISARHEDLVDAELVLHGIFSGVPETTKTIACLHYVDGLTLEETAKEVGMSVSGIRKRLTTLKKEALQGAGGIR